MSLVPLARKGVLSGLIEILPRKMFLTPPINCSLQLSSLYNTHNGLLHFLYFPYLFPTFKLSPIQNAQRRHGYRRYQE